MKKNKVILSDIKILVVVLSEHFSTIEKRALEDCLMHRDSGMQVKLFCLKKSLIGDWAQKSDIDIIYSNKKAAKREIDFKLLSEISKIVEDFDFDIVHLYSLKHFPVVSVALRRNTLTSLIITTNEALIGYKKNLLYRLLFRRVDSIFCFTERQRDLLCERLPVHQRKFHLIGMGIDINLENIKKIKTNEDEIIIGTFVSPDTQDLSGLKVYLDAIVSLGLAVERENSKGKKIKFSLASFLPWREHPMQKALMNELQLRNLDYIVSLDHIADLKRWVNELDLYVNHSLFQAIDYVEIFAQLLNVAVLYPRNGTHANYGLVDQGLIGESYAIGDARELRTKLLKLLDDAPIYQQQFRKMSKSIQEMHTVEGYLAQLTFHYEKLITQRARLSALKESPQT